MKKLGVLITICLFILMLFFPFFTQDKKDHIIELNTKETIDGNNYRLDYIDDKGNIAIHPTKGYATMIQIKDEDGHAIEEHYYNTNEKPVMCSGGYYGIHRIYQDGKCIEYTLVDQDGNPMEIAAGYSTIKQKYNHKNQVTEVYYYGKDGSPAMLSSGQYGEKREYDSEGRNYKSTYIDESGHPIETNKGYSTVRREYNQNNQVTLTWFYDLDGNHVDIGRGQYGILYIYENGQYVKSVPVDINGNEQFLLDQLLAKSPWLVAVSAILLILITILLNTKARFILFICYTLFIFYMTLFIRESGSQRYELELFWSYQQFFTSPALGLEVINNIWLFIPLGTLLASLNKKQRILLMAIVLSVFIESVQYFFGLGLCELDDIIGNSLGAWLGWCCFYEAAKLKYKLKSYGKQTD